MANKRSMYSYSNSSSNKYFLSPNSCITCCNPHSPMRLPMRKYTRLQKTNSINIRMLAESFSTEQSRNPAAEVALCPKQSDN